MNKFALALAALSLSAGAAFAENPYVGDTSVIQSGPNAGQSIVDRGTTASIRSGNSHVVQGGASHVNPSANRYGDGAPYAGR